MEKNVPLDPKTIKDEIEDLIVDLNQPILRQPASYSDMREIVWRLRDQGKSDNDIAKNMNMTIRMFQRRFPKLS